MNIKSLFGRIFKHFFTVNVFKGDSSPNKGTAGFKDNVALVKKE
jgi:hypothetical protein